MAASRRSLGVMFLRMINERSMATVINPSPPIWIRTMITVCPKVLQAVAVSTVINPVTQVALTAVNAASNGFVKVPSAEEKGRMSRIVPNRISAKKPTEKMAVELNLR